MAIRYNCVIIIVTICLYVSSGSILLPNGTHLVHECGNGTLFVDDCSDNEVSQVVSASYGKRDPVGQCQDNGYVGNTTCSPLDALDRVRGICDGNQTCDIPLSDDLFGNPCAGQIQKCVNVDYYCAISGQECACENETLIIQCSGTLRTFEIGISDATYQATYGGCNDTAYICPDIDVTEYFRGRCNSKNSCESIISTTEMGQGDPCHSLESYLEVKYTCEGAETKRPIDKCPAGIHKFASENDTAVVHLSDLHATGESVIVSCNFSSGVEFPVGTEYVECRVRDESSTNYTCTIQVNVTKDGDRELSELADVNVTTDNVLIVAKMLSVWVDNSVEIDDDTLEVISNILDDIVAVKDPSLNVTEYVINTVDNIIESYVGETSFVIEMKSVPEAPNHIQRSLEQQISILQTNPDIENATIRARHVTIQIVKVPKESGVSRRFVFEAIPGEQPQLLNTMVTTRDPGEQSDVEAAISFQLPIDIFSNIDVNHTLAVSFFVYNDTTLFPSTLLANKSYFNEDKDDVQRIVASRVISATVEDINVTNLPDDNPVETTFALNKIKEYEGEIDKINEIECVFWDVTASNGLGDWSSNDCQYKRTLSDDRVVCHCNHLTSFAVLVNIHGKSSKVLNIVSKVGCGISIACLLITLVTYLSSRSLREVKSKQILISFCFSLLFLYVVFVIGIERGTKPDIACVMVSALLHYFTLTSIAWMAVEAFQMYCSFVKVVGRWAHISRFLLKASFLAWGLPAVMVIIVIIADFNEYNNENYCFLKIGYTFYFTHLLVLALVVGVNTVIFGLVMHRLTCGRNKTGLNRNIKPDERKEAMRAVQNAIAISLLMGLTWVFGLFSLIHEDSSLVFQFIFCICNSFQGAYIFVMFCVRQPDVVAIWKDWISCCKTRGNKGHTKMDVPQAPGVVSDTTRKTDVASDVATSKL